MGKESEDSVLPLAASAAAASAAASADALACETMRWCARSSGEPGVQIEVEPPAAAVGGVLKTVTFTFHRFQLKETKNKTTKKKDLPK